MKKTIEIKWPWEMVWSESIDVFIDQIKDTLPPGHEYKSHKLFPGIKWDGRPIFIVENDTTGEWILMNFEKMKRWKKTKHKIPHMKIMKSMQEVSEMINNDHSKT